jgi:hypothetical protein
MEKQRCRQRVAAISLTMAHSSSLSMASLSARILALKEKLCN